VKRLRNEGEKRLRVLKKAVGGRWRTYQIGERLDNVTDKRDFGIKILLVESVIFRRWGRKVVIVREFQYLFIFFIAVR
jgi:hypothetical protein